MIEYKEMRKIVEDNSTTKSKVDNVDLVIGRYNNIMGLEGKDRYIWFDWISQTCSSMSDLEQSIAVEIKEYTPFLFDMACKIIKPERLDLPSAYATVANYIRENYAGISDEEIEDLDKEMEKSVEMIFGEIKNESKRQNFRGLYGISDNNQYT